MGVGIGNYGAAYGDTPAPLVCAAGHAHNVFINFLAEGGVIGWLHLSSSGSGLPGWPAAPGPRTGMQPRWHRRSRRMGYLSIHGLFDNLFVQHMQLQLALLLGSSLRSG